MNLLFQGKYKRMGQKATELLCKGLQAPLQVHQLTPCTHLHIYGQNHVGGGKNFLNIL